VDILRFAILGLGMGASYALIAQGIVVVQRGSRVLNFASAAVGMFSAYIFYQLWPQVLPWPLALAASLVAAAILGVTTYALLIRRARRSPGVVRIVLTLALMVLLVEVAVLLWAPTGQVRSVPSIVPVSPVEVLPGITVGSDRLYLAAIAVALTAVLAAVQRWTRFGLATTAVAEDPVTASALGYSPDLIAAANWALGSALASLAATLIAPIAGLDASALSLMIVPALAAALVGNFESYPLALTGGMGIGILQAEIGRFVSSPGWGASAPLLIIVGVLVLRGRWLPGRTVAVERPPTVGDGRIGLRTLVYVALGVGLVLAVSGEWDDALITTTVLGIVLLSVVVVTGYAGQLSLAQMALAAFGAYCTAGIAVYFHVPTLAAGAAAVVLTVALGLVIAVPATRTRGANLAIATLGLAVVIDQLIVSNPERTAWILAQQLPNPSLFGLDLSAIHYPKRFEGLAFALLVATALLVANLRRGRPGRRLLAVRSNERAAAALGISPPVTKLYAFGVGSALAGVGGVLIESRFGVPDFSSFTVLGSITVVHATVIGGIGWVGGAILGGAVSPAGLTYQLIALIADVNTNVWLEMISSVGAIAVLLFAPNGVLPLHRDQGIWIDQRVRRLLREWRFGQATGGIQDEGIRDVASSVSDSSRVTPATLVIDRLSVRFGGVVAIEDASLSVSPGEVVGLIGPNGAGKSTLLDSISGFNTPERGDVRINGRGIARLSPAARAQLGLGRTFQGLELFEDMTVRENVRVAADRCGLLDHFIDLVLPLTPALTGPAQQAIAAFGLGEDLDRQCLRLPYGTKRLVAMARAVASAPSVLLLDEPAAGSDERERSALSKLIRAMAVDRGMAVLLVEHDVDLVFRTCDRVVVMDHGQVIAQGPPAVVRSDPRVIAAYLGELPSAAAPAPPSEIHARRRR